jgi:hypothetical protein
MGLFETKERPTEINELRFGKLYTHPRIDGIRAVILERPDFAA